MANTNDDKRMHKIKIADTYCRAYALALTAQNLLQACEDEDMQDRFGKLLTMDLLDDSRWSGRRLLLDSVQARQVRRLNKALVDCLGALKPESPEARMQWETTCKHIAEVLTEHRQTLSRDDIVSPWAQLDDNINLGLS